MEIGGAERALYQLVREQRARGIEADILLGSFAGLYGKKAREIGANVTELLLNGPFDRSAARHVHELLAGYSIIHFHCAEPGLISLASKEKHLRRIYTHRAGLFTYRMKQLFRYKLTGRYLRNYFHGFSGNTRQACDAAARLYRIPRERFAVTYNGIDFTLLDPVRTREDVLAELGDDRGDIIRIGTSANLRELKRIDRLIDAVARLRDRPIRCYILGDGPARAQLEEQARSLGVDDRVIFTGKKERVGDYLQLFDIFVLPSGPEESFGNSAVEAMGVGIPTIVFSDGGGLVEHIDHEATGFIVDDTAGLTATIERLIDSSDLRSTIGAAARNTMRDRYSPARMVDRYTALYESGIKK